MKALYFRIGEFSRINRALLDALRGVMSDVEWREVDVEREIVRADLVLWARAVVGAWLRYGKRIVVERRPPRDFYVRLPVVLRAIRAWSRREVSKTSGVGFTFQTQSLFDAGTGRVPHFVYTDHTYLANARYPEPKAMMPVAAAWRTMERGLYAGAACTFVSSAFAAESVREDYGVASERVENVGSGCNVNLPGRVVRGERSGRVILFVGVDWERKGGPEIVTAFREVRREVPGAELWIVGCSPEVREAGVVVRGRLTAEETADCYARADVFCLPSRMDPSASVLAEAAGNGLPVVATPVGGNVERVIDGVTGYLAGPTELAGRLTELLRDAALRERMGVAGREMVLADFMWAAVAAKMARRIQTELSEQ